ncbi:MAG: hypothetical protein QG610_1970 [Euryarchaeota archaeon]|nr:hypothetical protein [Euryarchaeota archaeon]
MRLCFKYLLMAMVMVCILEGLLPVHAGAQISPLPGYYNYYNYYNSPVPFQYYGANYPLIGNPYSNPYAGWGMMNLYSNPLTALSPWGSGYLGNSFNSPYSLQNEIQSYMELINTYNYLQYAIKFYETARNVPLLYLQDVQADQIGALIYTYADSLGVSPDEAALNYIKQNFLTQQK